MDHLIFYSNINIPTYILINPISISENVFVDLAVLCVICIQETIYFGPLPTRLIVRPD